MNETKGNKRIWMCEKKSVKKTGITEGYLNVNIHLFREGLEYPKCAEMSGIFLVF